MKPSRVNHSVADLISTAAPDLPVRKPDKKKSRRNNGTAQGHKKTASVDSVASPGGEDQDEAEPLDHTIDDPYCVTQPCFTYVSREEYNDSSRVSIDPGVTFDFARFQQVSRHAYINPRIPNPEQYYCHDPVVLFDAITLATNIEAVTRRAATQIPYQNLLLTENNDVARVIDSISRDERMRDAVKNAGMEYLFALMAVENATRHPPASIKEMLK